MKIAYLDTIAGIAGDMTMAAFVSAGLSIDELSAELKKLPLTGFELIGKHVMRNSIAAVHIDVSISHTPHYHRHLKDINAIIDFGIRTTPALAVDGQVRIHGRVPTVYQIKELIS